MGRRVLIIGNGGREHALAWQISQSPRLDKLYVAPGNGGTGTVAENVAIKAGEFHELAKFAEKNRIDLVVVGPDDPLALGIVDYFREKGFKIFGPTKAAAELESSKVFAKQFMAKNRIPTARFASFSNAAEALEHLRNQVFPVVVKASGLALGKGVIVCRTAEEAEAAIRKVMLDKIFGEAGREIVIEEFLEGQEISVHVLSDGKNYSLFPTSQDHKPVGDNDTGPNTGGMGTIAPVPWVSQAQMLEIEKSIVKPALQGMVRLGREFGGLLYPGLKITAAGPKVLEFNARFGDPETQSYVRLLESDLLEMLEACAAGALNPQTVMWRQEFAVCVVMASGGYPGAYQTGKRVTGIGEAEAMPGVKVFHAGTIVQDDVLLTAGGRVLGVTASALTLTEALAAAYQAVKVIKFEGAHYRTDIGREALAAD